MAGVAGAGRPSNIKNPVETIANAVTPQIAPLPAPVSEAPMAGVPGSSVPAEPQLEASTADPYAELDAFAELDAPSDPFAELDEIFGQAPMAERQKPTTMDEWKALSDDEKKYFQEQEVRNSMGMESDTKTNLPLGADALKGFASNDTEKQSALEQYFGSENVRKQDNDLQIKKDGKWKTVNEQGLLTRGSNPLSALASNASTAVEMGVGVGTTAAMLAGGAALSGTGVGAPAGLPMMVAANATGALAGKKAKDVFAEHVLGLKRDESRSELMEDGLTVLFGGAGGAFTKWVGNYAAKKGAQIATSNALAGADESLENVVKESAALVEAAKKAGLVDNIAGTDVVLTPEQIVSNSKLADNAKLADKGFFARTTEQVQQFLRLQGDMLDGAWQKTVGKVANITDRNAQQKAGDAVSEAFDAAKSIEGKAIQHFREDAISASGNAKIAVPKIKASVDEVFSDLGLVGDGTTIAFKNGENVVPITTRSLGDALKTDSGQVTRNFGRTLTRLHSALEGNEGRMQMAEVHEIYTDLTKQIDALPHTEKAAKDVLIRVKNAVRDQFLESAEVILADTPKAAGYKTAMANYGPVIKAADRMGKLLEADSINARSFAKSIFSSTNKDALDRLEITRDVLAHYSDNPDAFKNLVGGHISNLMDQFKNANGQVQYGKVMKELGKLDDRALRIMFDGDINLGNIQLIGKLAEKIENAASKGAKLDAEYMSLGKAALQGKFLSAGYKLLMNLRGGDWVSWLSQGGQEKILESMAPKARPAAQAAFEKLVTAARSKAGQVSGAAITGAL